MTQQATHPISIPWLTIGLCLGSLLLFFSLGAAPESLLYSRPAVSKWELWRLFSAHFVHCDPAHLGWNLSGLLILGALLEQRLGARILGVIGISCLGVSGWLWTMKTELLLYCGLSGMLNGLLAVLLVILWRESRHPLLLFVGAGAVLKIAIEGASGQAIFTQLSWASVPGAHGAGLVAGILYLFIKRCKGKIFPEPERKGGEDEQLSRIFWW